MNTKLLFLFLNLCGMHAPESEVCGSGESMAQKEAAPPGSSSDPCMQMSLWSEGTSLSASACRSAAERPRTCARSAPACCGLSLLERENPSSPRGSAEKRGVSLWCIKLTNYWTLIILYYFIWGKLGNISRSLSNCKYPQYFFCLFLTEVFSTRSTYLVLINKELLVGKSATDKETVLIFRSRVLLTLILPVVNRSLNNLLLEKWFNS